MSYRKLFGLDIFHDYYQDRICPDFSIEPTPACEKIIKDHRLILKKKLNGIQVIARFNSEGKPWIQLAESLKFTFVLKLNNIKFIDFTDIALQPNNNSVYLFSNQNTKTSESSELEQKVEEVSRVSLSQKHNVWGVVEIYNNASFPRNSNYKIVFRAKQQYWKYYLIANKDTQADEFEIKDQEQTRSPKISFVPREIDEQDPVVAMITQQFPVSQQYLFQSKNKISDREVPRKNIQLLKKEIEILETPEKKQRKRRNEQKRRNIQPSSMVWIEHLPNPPNGDATKIINLLKKV